MTDSFCRIGVFYDGSYFAYAQRHFYRDRKLGWLEFRGFHELLENFVRVKEQGYNSYRVVYAAWFQGLFPVTQSDEQRLRFDRNLYHDLMHAGIDPKYIPTSQAGKSEKGADVALAIDALQIGLERKIDIAALVTGDADMIPLARALMKHGVRVVVAHFDYKTEKDHQFANQRLLAACNYTLNINQLERDKDFKTSFKMLFRKAEPKPST